MVQFPCCAEWVVNIRRMGNPRKCTTDQARVGETLVKLMVAKGPRVAGPTEALKAAWEVAADAVVADVLLIALVHVFGAGGSIVTIGTGAPVR